MTPQMMSLDGHNDVPSKSRQGVYSPMPVVSITTSHPLVMGIRIYIRFGTVKCFTLKISQQQVMLTLALREDM